MAVDCVAMRESRRGRFGKLFLCSIRSQLAQEGLGKRVETLSSVQNDLIKVTAGKLIVTPDKFVRCLSSKMASGLCEKLDYREYDFLLFAELKIFP